jgi:hypothetical protein
MAVNDTKQITGVFTSLPNDRGIEVFRKFTISVNRNWGILSEFRT